MKESNKKGGSFQEELVEELRLFQAEQQIKFPKDEVLKIDLHCHDHNSDVPDELLGRILNVPETWLKTEQLKETLKKNGCNALTITNHNNARSCYELRDKGEDVLVGAEFSCMVPDYNVGIHVLTYGFDQQQEKILNKLRRNVYAFQEYAFSEDLPTIWAHPLFHYHSDGVPSLDFFGKLALIFERFEVLNGQRDTWQNMLVKVWLETLTPEKIDELSLQTGIDPRKYCKDPYLKRMSGGSDSHMGIFPGLTGTYLHVPHLRERLLTSSRADLALEAIRRGRMAPYGSHHNSEKMTVAFVDYVCQIALNHHDPGLLRVLLHKGTPQEKLTALLVSNGFAELQRHKVTMNFVSMVHQCFNGKAPSLVQRVFVPHVYKSIFDEVSRIAAIDKTDADSVSIAFKDSIYAIHASLTKIFYDRLSKKFKRLKDCSLEKVDLNELIRNFELPADIRVLIGNSEVKTWSKNGQPVKTPDVKNFLDGLSFPFLASSLILAAHFTSAKALYNVRPLLQSFSEQLGRLQHPKRMLWLTDTFEDNNGVSMVLKEMHQEVKRLNLPIDFMVCSNTLQPDDHLIVLKPMAEFNFSFYQQQTVRVPDFLEIHTIFQEREYDRVISSTEGVMGLAAIWLKNAYSVKAYTYLHTDWLTFAKKVLSVDRHNINHLRRFLRAYYRQFDDIFVLNTDQQKWLTGKDMEFDQSKVHLTAHWVGEEFCPDSQANKKELFGVSEEVPVLVFVGRISKEKGIEDLCEIYNQVRVQISEIRLVVVGTGPDEQQLKEQIPDAIYLGWVEHSLLPQIYSAADLLILPSKFDTFSCVVLEAMSCGLPVVAYKTKGPADIIENEKSGFLVSIKDHMIHRIISYFGDLSLQQKMKNAAIVRSKQYKKRKIMQKFLHDVDL